MAALVVGDILGAGIFFTPGEVASVAESPWQVYFLWGLCGGITLCGVLTVAELTTLVPQAGASYHVIGEAFGPFAAFVKIWVEMWCGVRWGGRTQILLTVLKIIGVLALVTGSLILTAPAAPTAAEAAKGHAATLLGLVGLVGLGVPAVLFTYDGWLDVTHVAGEVRQPARHLPLALGLGVGGLTLLYLVVNHAYLRVVPLEAMRTTPTTAVATTVARAAFGTTGGQILNVLIIVSILGALGGLVMTLPRLYYAAAAQYREVTAPRRVSHFFRALAWVPVRTAVPAGIVTYFVVPVHVVNILLVASVFRLRRRLAAAAGAYRTPGYPLVPAMYIFVLALLLASAIAYNPLDTLFGVAMTATGLPVYLWIRAPGRP